MVIYLLKVRSTAEARIEFPGAGSCPDRRRGERQASGSDAWPRAGFRRLTPPHRSGYPCQGTRPAGPTLLQACGSGKTRGTRVMANSLSKRSDIKQCNAPTAQAESRLLLESLSNTPTCWASSLGPPLCPSTLPTLSPHPCAHPRGTVGLSPCVSLSLPFCLPPLARLSLSSFPTHLRATKPWSLASRGLRRSQRPTSAAGHEQAAPGVI